VPEQPRGHLEVLPSSEVLVDRHRLAGQADLRLDPIGVFDHVEPRHGGVTGVGFQQRRQDAYRGRLARAVRPEHREQCSLVHVEIEPVQCFDAPVMLDQFFGGDGVLCNHP